MSVRGPCNTRPSLRVNTTKIPLRADVFPGSCHDTSCFNLSIIQFSLSQVYCRDGNWKLSATSEYLAIHAAPT